MVLTNKGNRNQIEAKGR